MSLNAVANLKPSYLQAAEELRHNPGQWRAYESRGNCIILAGPGSGKTKTLTIKMARMLNEDIKLPRGIACITFNSECVRELKRRLDRLGIQQSANVFIGTVHLFCLRNIVVPYGRLAGLNLPETIEVASLDQQDRALEKALSEKINRNEHPASWRTRFDEYRRTHLDRESTHWSEDDELAGLIEEYEKQLRLRNLIDFDDMVLLGLRLIEENEWIRKALRARFPILVVDEYQDLGVPLHRIVLSLLKSGIRLLAVGDPDQSIYGFTGARPELLQQLSRTSGVETIRLRFNYRSGKTIVDASEAALGETRGYQAKGGYTGTVDFYECPDGLEEQATIICQKIIPAALKRLPGRKPGDIAVLYLDKNDGDVIARCVSESKLKSIRIDRGAPYPKTALIRWLEDCAAWCSVGWKTGEPRLSGLVKSWLEFNRSTKDDREVQNLRLKLVRFLFSHRTGELLLAEWITDFKNQCLDQTLERELTLGDEREALAKLTGACKKDQLKGLTLAVFAGQSGDPDHLNLITLHSAKGMEFDVVILMGMEQGRIPSWGVSSELGKREPRRLFYVGVTRARHEVHMTYSGYTVNKYGHRFENGPSEFLLEVQSRLS